MTSVDNATCELVDTSDTEEREVLYAQAPGYHQRVWGDSLFKAGAETKDESDQFQPSTPSARETSIGGCVVRAHGEGLPYSAVTDVNGNTIASGFRLPSSHDSPFSSSPDPLALPPLTSGQDYSEVTDPLPTPKPGPRGRSIPRTPNMFLVPSITGSQTPLSPLTPLPPPPVVPPDPPPDVNSLARPYSLRNRSAKQLNPFEYDKRLYKRQLRGIPEAIVENLAAPRRSREHYREEDEDSGEQSSEGSRDDVWREKEARRERREERMRREEIADQRIRELGIAVPGEEEGDEMYLLGADLIISSETVKTITQRRNGDHGARDRSVHASETPLPCTLQGEESVGRPRSRPWPRPAFRGPPTRPDPSSSQRRMSPPISPEPINYDPGPDSHAELGEPSYLSPQNHRDMHPSREFNSSVMDDRELSVRSTDSMRRSLSGNEREDSDVSMVNASDDQPSSSEESSGMAMTAKDRRRLKALSRMMPAAHMKKLLAEEDERMKRKRRSMGNRSESSDGDEDSISIPRGRGRKRIVSPGSKDPKRYEIRGDPESDEERNPAPSQNQDIINLVSSEDQQNDVSEQSPEESEDGLDAGDIQDWLAPDLECEPDQSISLSVPRMHRVYEQDKPRGEDLIDRMLQRTNRVRRRDTKPSKRQDKNNNRGPRNPVTRPMLDVVTREARRLGGGGGRQTKLKFHKAGGPRATNSSRAEGHHKEHRAETHVAPTKKKKTKKHSRRTLQTQFHFFQNNGYNITSGRKTRILSIADNGDDLYEALAPVNAENPEDRPHITLPDADNKRQGLRKYILERFRTTNTSGEPDVFDRGKKNSHIVLDFDIPLLPSGMTFGAESYTGKTRLAQLVSIIKNELEAPRPLTVTVFEQNIDPDLSAIKFSELLGTICDRLYDASITAIDAAEMPLRIKTIDVTTHTLCQWVSFRAWHGDDADGHVAIAVSEQMAHLTEQIDRRLEMLSADGYILDSRTFALYWFAVELELRVAFAQKKRDGNEASKLVPSIAAVDRYATLLLRRLLEYGMDRTLRPLQRPEALDIMSPDVRTMELWTCMLHLAPYLGESDGNASIPFWRIVHAAMDQQSNMPESGLDKSEYLWQMIFSLCALSQFSVHGLTTSTIRLGQNWSMVSRALGCIRLHADEELDRGKLASTLKRRDQYLRLVTARCFLLDLRYHWPLRDADQVLRDLCSIFRSRKFSNLLGETSDFPIFIRERDETLFHVNTEVDTAYGLFLKMIIRALKEFPEHNEAARTKKMNKLLGLAVPVGPMSFTKASPPIGPQLSMLYNRYSAIIVAIYVEPTPDNIGHRLQQIRRYIAFKDADCDSQAASIRAMMNLAIFLRHLNHPLGDVLSWASEMMNDLLENFGIMEKDPNVSSTERGQVVVLIHLLLGSVRMVIENPVLDNSEPRPSKYPDVELLPSDWIESLLSTPSLSNDPRTGIEIRKCVQSFLAARKTVVPSPSVPEESVDQVESQDFYGDSGLNMDDPAVLALLDSLGGPPDENYASDKKAAQILGELATKRIYGLVCRHFGQTINWQFPGGYFLEGELWIECWLGCASVAIQHNMRDWGFYITMTQAACEGIKNNVARRQVFMRCMLTMLQLDPTSYHSNEEKFLGVWFEGIVSPEITIEHEFSGLLLSVGALRHPLFQDPVFAAKDETGIVRFERSDFDELRRTFIEVVIGNAAQNVTELHISLIVKMLKVLSEGLQSLDGATRTRFADMGGFVHASIGKHRILADSVEIRALLS